MKIPFDIKYKPQIESGEYKVENRIGEQVRIVCYDAKIHFTGNEGQKKPIISLQTSSKGDEMIFHHFETGELFPHEVTAYDLFVVTPESEPSEFDDCVRRLIDMAHGLGKDHPYNTDKGALFEEYSSQLLSLAREKIGTTFDKASEYLRGRKDGIELGKAEALEGVKKNWRDYFSPQDITDVYNAGKNDALNDLPTWKKATASFGNYTVAPTETGSMCLLIDGHFILLKDLMKLPGFKDGNDKGTSQREG